MSITVNVLTIGLCIALAVIFSRTLQKLVSHADSMHLRNQVHISDLVDRIMAVDFAAYKAQASAESAPTGGFEPPDDPELLDDSNGVTIEESRGW